MIPRPADGHWPARTPADAALILAAFGCDPSLAPLRPTTPGRAAWTGPTRQGKVGTYLFALDRPDAEPGDFGAGTSRALDPTDLHDLCLSLLYSVPDSTDLLGVSYLEQLLARLNLALVCREQIRRFLPAGADALPLSAFHQPPPPDMPLQRTQLDQLDHELASRGQQLAAARRVLGPLPEPEQLLGFDQSYRVPDDERPGLPKPGDGLDAVRALLAGRWSLVADALPDAVDTALLRHQSGATLRVIGGPDGTVHGFSLREGGQAVADLARYGFALTPDARDALLGALRLEAPLAASEAALQGAPVQLTPIARMDAGSGRSHRFHLVEQHQPRRRSAVLATLVTDSGDLVGRALIEEVGAIDQLSRLMRRLTRQTAEDPGMRALAALDEIRAAFEPELRDFTRPGADYNALSERYRPRAGDAQLAFNAGVADAVASANEALWRAGEARVRPQPGQTELTVHLAPAGALAHDNALSHPFPGGMRGAAAQLSPSRVWASIVFHRPGEARGMRYDGFVWLDDHWAWFPKPWRMLGDTAR